MTEYGGMVARGRAMAGRGRLLAAVLAIVATAGCGTPKFGRTPLPEDYAKPDYTLILSPGDEVSVTFVGAPQLNTTQMIRRDGKVTLLLLGEYQAAGKSPTRLQQEILMLYEPQLQIKEVAVIVVSPAPVYVSGAVGAPGELSIMRPFTVLEAIAKSGGFNEMEAELRNVLVIRHKNGKRTAFALNFSGILKGKESEVFYLEPLDIVYVPRTRIVKVGQWVNQHINAMIPQIPFGFLIN